MEIRIREVAEKIFSFLGIFGIFDLVVALGGTIFDCQSLSASNQR